jgi:hypothetical protein
MIPPEYPDRKGTTHKRGRLFDEGFVRSHSEESHDDLETDHRATGPNRRGVRSAGLNRRRCYSGRSR